MNEEFPEASNNQDSQNTEKSATVQNADAMIKTTDVLQMQKMSQT